MLKAHTDALFGKFDSRQLKPFVKCKELLERAGLAADEFAQRIDFKVTLRGASHDASIPGIRVINPFRPEADGVDISCSSLHKTGAVLSLIAAIEEAHRRDILQIKLPNHAPTVG